MPRKKKRTTRVPESKRRVPFAVRLPVELLEEFRDICEGKEPREITRVIETAVRNYVRRNRRG